MNETTDKQVIGYVRFGVLVFGGRHTVQFQAKYFLVTRLLNLVL